MSTETPQPPNFAAAQAQLVAANNLREERKYGEALLAGHRAITAFQALGNGIKAAESAATLALAFRNQANEQEDARFRDMLLSEALIASEEAVRIGRDSGEPTALAIPLFNKAKVLEDMGRLDEAVVVYEEAVTNPLPDEFKNAPGVIADMRRHYALAVLAFMSEQEVLDDAFEATNLAAVGDQRREITAMPDQYEKWVWLSGIDMGLAEYFLLRGNREKATEYAQRAMETIINNIARFPNLETRRRQMEKFAHDAGIQLKY